MQQMNLVIVFVLTITLLNLKSEHALIDVRDISLWTYV